MNIDPEQLEFLMSQAIDGQLSDEDAELLDRCLAENPDARADLERMRRLDSLIGHWGRQPVPMDEGRFKAALGERVQEDPEFIISQALDGDEQAEEALASYAQREPGVGLLEHQYRRAEMLVRSWGDYEPPVDHDLFYERLCQTIRTDARPKVIPWPRKVIRLYTPLAAAASILIALGAWWIARQATVEPAPGQPQIQVALVGPPSPKPGTKAVVQVSFGIAQDAPIQTVARASEEGGSAVVISIGGFKGPRTRPEIGSDEMIF
ncbi:MAG: hypothetical protein JXQ73_33220 [Phycisphaerae bacterium]|nr:hypothetical protein [Phycisphaerae bacterium]